jgi:hypothetical protein
MDPEGWNTGLIESGPTFDTGGETRAEAEAGSCVMAGELAR